MMRKEAAWLGARLAALPTAELTPMLSVGSGTKEFRARFQPWIEPAVYEPLAARGIEVLHHEMHAADGVDVVGDLGELAVRHHLQNLGVRSILCLNVFEHVTDRVGLARSLVLSLPVGGILVVTVPHRFPYHADPIDTLFRPEPAALCALFSGVEVVDSGIVTCESLASHWLSKPGKLSAVGKALKGARGSSDSGSTDSAPVADHREFAGPSIMALLSMAALSTDVTYAIFRRTEA